MSRMWEISKGVSYGGLMITLSDNQLGENLADEMCEDE